MKCSHGLLKMKMIINMKSSNRRLEEHLETTYIFMVYNHDNYVGDMIYSIYICSNILRTIDP